MNQVYVSIGSNIDREKNIAAGLLALEKLFGRLVISSCYESASVGFAGDAFYNLVVKLNTALNVYEVVQQLKRIEVENGRTSACKKFSPRKLDLDLLLYDDLVIHDEFVNLPRADIEQYAFVLEPLAEIAPTLEHPVLKISYTEMWRAMNKCGISQQRISAATYNQLRAGLLWPANLDTP